MSHDVSIVHIDRQVMKMYMNVQYFTIWEVFRLYCVDKTSSKVVPACQALGAVLLPVRWHIRW